MREGEGGWRRLFVVGGVGNVLCVLVLSCLAVLCELQLCGCCEKKKKKNVVKLKLTAASHCRVYRDSLSAAPVAPDRHKKKEIGLNHISFSSSFSISTHSSQRHMGNSTSANKDSLESMTLGSLLLGPPPADWDSSKDSIQHGSITSTSPHTTHAELSWERCLHVDLLSQKPAYNQTNPRLSCG